jgi:hypothetical protein
MKRRTWIIAGIVVVLAGMGFGVSVAVERVRESAARSMCNLGQLGVAFHAYADTHEGKLPPAAVCDPNGKPLLSWRVLLLPYLEEQARFEKFKLDEPWDSPHNLKLLDRMPTTYKAPWTKNIDVPSDHTVLHVFVGPGAAFEWNRGLSLKDDFPDGIENTLLYVEAGPPVPWTKPEELPFDGPAPARLRGLFRDGSRAMAVNGSGYLFILHDYDEARLRASITRNGGEKLDPVWNR